MSDSDFSDIVSPRGAGALSAVKRKPKGALQKFAEGGAVDYTDPNATIAALTRSLDALSAKPSGQGQDLSQLGFQAGLLSPTKSGSFLESLGSGYRGQLGAIEADRDRALRTAALAQSIPTTGLQAAGLAQTLQQKKMFQEDLAAAQAGAPGPIGGISPTGKPMAVPSISGAPPPISAGAAPPAAPGAQIVQGAPFNPQAQPRAPGSTISGDVANPGLVAPQEAPPPIAAPRVPVQTAPLQAGGVQPGAGGGYAVPPPLAAGIRGAAPGMAPFAGQEQAGAMTRPSDPSALPIPTQLAQQYQTTFNRMTRMANGRTPEGLEVASKLQEQLKGLIPAGFAMLPDGSGIVPIGDKAPAYLLNAKAANEMLVPDGKGGFTNAGGVVGAAAQKAGAVKGAEAWAQVGAHNAEETHRQALTAQREQGNEAYKTYLDGGVWPPGYGPSGNGQPVAIAQGIVTPQGTVVPPPPKQEFVGANALKHQDANTAEIEKNFGKVRGGLEGTESRMKALAQALQVVQSGGLVEERAAVSNTLRGIPGMEWLANAIMDPKKTSAVQTAIGVQVLDVLGQLKQINSDAGGRILNSEFTSLIGKQYGPNLSPQANFDLLTQGLGGVYQTRAMIDDYYGYAKPAGWRDAVGYQSAYYKNKANSYDMMVKQAGNDIGPLKGMKGAPTQAAAPAPGTARAPVAQQQQAPAPPKAGTVMDGYTFKGGDPADKNNWAPAQ